MCFGLGMPSIKAQQLTHAFKEDCNPTFKPFQYAKLRIHRVLRIILTTRYMKQHK